MEWLSARLTEDEAVAKAAARRFEKDVAAFKSGRPPDMEDLPGETAADWSGGTDEDETGYFRAAVWAGEGITTICEMESEYDQTSPEHIARWDPARVLAEVAAKRRIIEHVVRGRAYYWDTDNTLFPPGLAILGALALPYADRPGYRDEWRPR